MPARPPQHRPLGWRPPQEDRRPWRGWYKTKRWCALRSRRLRDEPLCRFCLERGRPEPATIVDHVKPHRGDEALFFAYENTASLCKPCHDGAKQAEERGDAPIGCGVDGLPLDPGHPWRRAEG